MLTANQLRAIRERAERATPGPWNLHANVGYCGITAGDKTLWAADGATFADGSFTAHAREDIPALLAHIDELVSLLREARWLIGSYAPGLRPVKYDKLLDEMDAAIAIHDAAREARLDEEETM